MEISNLSSQTKMLLAEVSTKGFNSVNFDNYLSSTIGELIDFLRSPSLDFKLKGSKEEIISKLSELYNSRLDLLEFNGFSIEDEWALLFELKGNTIPSEFNSVLNRKKLDDTKKWELFKEFVQTEKQQTQILFRENDISFSEKETWLRVWNKIEEKIKYLDTVGVTILNPEEFSFSKKAEV